MVRELLYKLAFFLLLLLTALVFGRSLVHAQASVAVTVDVAPKVVMANPYKRQTFRFRWRIEPNDDNRRYSIAYTCGKEVASAQREIDGTSPKTSERFVELTVVDDCVFTACVVRVTEGKAKTICAHQTVSVAKEEPP